MFASRVTTSACRWLSIRQNARRLHRNSTTVSPKILISIRRSWSSITTACLSTPCWVLWCGASVAWILGFLGMHRPYGRLAWRVSHGALWLCARWHTLTLRRWWRQRLVPVGGGDVVRLVL